MGGTLSPVEKPQPPQSSVATRHTPDNPEDRTVSGATLARLRVAARSGRGLPPDALYPSPARLDPEYAGRREHNDGGRARKSSLWTGPALTSTPFTDPTTQLTQPEGTGRLIVSEWATACFASGLGASTDEVKAVVREVRDAARDDFDAASARLWANGYTFPDEYVNSDARCLQAAQLDFTTSQDLVGRPPQ